MTTKSEAAPTMPREETIRRLTVLRDEVMKPLLDTPERFDISTWGLLKEPEDREPYLNGKLKDHTKLSPDYQYWGNGRLFTPEFNLLECNSTCCVLGSAASYKPFRELGLELIYSNMRTLDIADLKAGTVNFSAGASFFGIPQFASDFLFDPTSYSYINVDDDGEEAGEDDPDYRPVTIEDSIRHIDVVLYFLTQEIPLDLAKLESEAIARL